MKQKNYETARHAIICVLLLWILSINVYLSYKTPPTSDEYTFVASGYSYWKTFDFRMNTEQPPLIKLINTIPLLFMDIKLPLEHESWKKAKLFGNDGFYKEFVFGANNDKKEIMLTATRITNSVLSLILAIIILIWATQIFGKLAGVLALTMYSFEPTIIAFSGLFMIDIGLALFTTIALYTLWRFLNKPTATNWFFAAMTFGLAQLTKHTAIMLYGIYPVIMLAHYLILKQYSNKKTLLAASYIGIAIVGLLFINATYGFKGTLQTAQQMFNADNNIDKTIYTPAKLFSNKYLKFISEKIPLPLPYQYIKGLGYVTAEAKSPRTTYLFGRTSDKGFWHYYIISFLAKTPIPLLIILLTATIYFFTANKNWKNELALIIPTIIYTLLFSTNQKQIGIRHLLQIYPLIIIFASRIANISVTKKIIGKIAIIALTFLSMIEVAIAFPDYISYANEFIGINNGYKYFADTNIELAQDIDKAINFINNNPKTKVAIDAIDLLEEYVNYTKAEKCEKGLIMTNANTLNTNPKYRGLKCKMPSQRLGRTIFIYNITKC